MANPIVNSGKLKNGRNWVKMASEFKMAAQNGNFYICSNWANQMSFYIKYGMGIPLLILFVKLNISLTLKFKMAAVNNLIHFKF